MTTVSAHFDGKVFVPDEPVGLPVDTPVRLVVEAVCDRSVLEELAEIADQFPITDAPPDWSEQHDHYTHGVTKR